MSQLLPSVHSALACIWLGCIVTEIIVERNLSFTGEGFRVRLSQLNWKVAAYVEVPAFLGVLVTGAYILGTPHAMSPGFQVMITVGLLTIFLNVFKVWLIYKRLSAALRSSWAAHEKLIYFQRVLGVLVLAGVLTAIVAGVIGKSAT
jgi:hypothetical protein